MNKLTTIKTIKKAAPLALLAVVMSGSAFAGPGNGKGDRPKGPKLSIDVYNDCTANGTSLDITTTVTPSGSELGDGGAQIQTPIAYAALKEDVCEENKGGKLKCSQGFVPKGQGDDIDDLMDYSGPLTWTKSIDVCALDSSLTAGTVVNAEVSVPVDYDSDVTTTWVSRCDDDPSTNCYDSATGEYYVCEKYDESIVNLETSCQ